MLIKRREILKAIRTERLKAGSFIQHSYGEYTDKCKVCAVGAVLRQKGIDNNDIDTVAYWATGDGDVTEHGNFKMALAEKNYLSALSIKFEQLALKYGCGVRTRNKLCNFVKKNFPKQIKVNL